MKEEQTEGLSPENLKLVDYLWARMAISPTTAEGLHVCWGQANALLDAARAEGAEAAAAKLKQVERALEPFAREADEWGATWSDAHRPEQDEARATFTVGDLRRARQALSSIRQTESMG